MSTTLWLQLVLSGMMYLNIFDDHRKDVVVKKVKSYRSSCMIINTPFYLPRSGKVMQKCRSKTSKTGLQRPAARYDGIGKIGGGYGFLVPMVSRVVSRCPWLPSWGHWLPKFVPCYLKWSLVA